MATAEDLIAWIEQQEVSQGPLAGTKYEVFDWQRDMLNGLLRPKSQRRRCPSLAATARPRSPVLLPPRVSRRTVRLSSVAARWQLSRRVSRKPVCLPHGKRRAAASR